MSGYKDNREQNTIIRGFKPSDLDEVIKIMVYSFESKFHAMSDMTTDQIIDFFHETGFIEGESFEGYFVVEVEGKVVGVMVLRWHGQETGQDVYNINIRALKKKYGFKNTMKLIAGLALLSDSVDKGDCYIEHIAVAPEYRGHGIGSMLIDEAKVFVNNMPKIKSVTLHVAASNIGATLLYEKHGFKTVNRHSSALTKWILNEQIWLHMAWHKK